MNIYKDRTALTAPPACGRVVTIGVFDGVHLGHAAILSETVRRAKALAAEAAALTFTTHPRALISGEAPPLICALGQRLEFMEAIGIQTAFALPFDETMRNLRPESFLEEFMKRQLGARALVLGHDARFGRHRKGDAEFAKSKGFDITEVEPVIVNQVRASSGQVRNAVLEGRLADAAALLGRDFNIRGIVEKGHGRGIGFATANLNLQHDLKPPRGVYSGYTVVDGAHHLAVLNIGVRPTFEGGEETIEVHIPGWSEDLYGQTLDVSLVALIRQERKFRNVESLKSQIAQDIDHARAAYLGRNIINV